MPSSTPPDRSTGRASVPGSNRSAEPARPARSGARLYGSARGTGGGTGTGAAAAARAAANAPRAGALLDGRYGDAPVRPGGGRPGGPGGRPPQRSGARPRWGRIALVVAAALVLLGGVGAAGASLYYKSLDGGLGRTDPFSAVTDGRPVKAVSGALNILLLGSDSRDPDSKASPGEWRTDTMILMHVPASHDKAYLISLPRDLYVHVPQSKTNPELGNTRAKLNAAFAWGGLPLVVQTIEGFTDVRVDHVILIDFGGFQQVVDALGGVDMNVERDLTSIHQPFRHFTKGTNHFNGAQALDYCRQRYQFPDGDFARMRHQQELLKAALDKAASGGTLSNPVKLNAFLKSATRALTVDKDFSMADMAVQFRNIRSKDLTFLVSPNLGSQTVDGESVVVSDKPKASALFEAVRRDTVGSWVASEQPSAKPGG
jgi:LCP family protein required for cell wall assembly